MNSLRRGPLHGRRAAGAVFGLFVAVGLIVVFGGTLGRSTDIEAKAAQAKAEVLALEARVAAGDAELRFFETDAFVLQQARAHGFGEKGETRFALPEDAPSPEPIVPIGSDRDQGAARPPFDAWMDLLFGA